MCAQARLDWSMGGQLCFGTVQGNWAKCECALSVSVFTCTFSAFIALVRMVF